MGWPWKSIHSLEWLSVLMYSVIIDHFHSHLSLSLYHSLTRSLSPSHTHSTQHLSKWVLFGMLVAMFRLCWPDGSETPAVGVGGCVWLPWQHTATPKSSAFPPLQCCSAWTATIGTPCTWKQPFRPWRSVLRVPTQGQATGRLEAPSCAPQEEVKLSYWRNVWYQLTWDNFLANVESKGLLIITKVVSHRKRNPNVASPVHKCCFSYIYIYMSFTFHTRRHEHLYYFHKSDRPLFHFAHSTPIHYWCDAVLYSLCPL